MPKVPHREVPAGISGLPVVLSYSDGEGAWGQIGVAIWARGAQIGRAGVIRFPEAVRDRWDPKRACDRYNDIYEVEAMGPLTSLENFGDIVRNSLWLHFIDNGAALSTLVSGSSSVMSGDEIAGLTWSHIAGFKCFLGLTG